ncbi:hypothetical protein MMYC01_201299 [Madurella mycetomatis]|uniref:AB hydrolase-1 domain-containing protein n=1 Tax=Madurella mycetomatis TaxID=100816 RepID=A0A175WFI0_9PEZI|nr:hypothetical protein MMYC01_201299 [Madurella mycetomatis]
MVAPVDYVLDPRFSRTFELPADPASNGRTGPFKVKYADYGYRNDAHPEQENALLFFGPLMASRLFHIAKDELAKRRKIRIINLDRPGIGGTDPADAKDRMSLWLDVIPALLAHLGISHVSVACHSGGTIWALDFILHQPQLLHPSRPYLAIGGPWILPTHTNSTSLSILQHLPVSVLANTDKFARLVNNHIGPTLGASFGFTLDILVKLVPASFMKESNVVNDDNDANGGANAEPEGASFEEEIWASIIDRVYADGVQGISVEAVLLMQRIDGVDGWGDWGDYDKFVPRLAEALRAAGMRLRVDVFYAEKDHMIGDGGSKGPLWFDQCWNETSRGGVIDYQSRTVKGADHDRIWNLRWGTMQEVFERIGEPVGGDASNAGEEMQLQ